MQAKVEINAGICGFRTTAAVASADDQNVTFTVTSDCEKIRKLGLALQAKGPVDAYQEIATGAEGVLLTTTRACLCGCCSGCIVPTGLFKGMQVAAGLALPKDLSVRLTKE